MSPSPETPALNSNEAAPWRIVAVDDDPLVHSTTRFLMSDLTFRDRPIEYHAATSSDEAIRLLRDGAEPAVILMDVVMDRPDAGLQLASLIREDLGNSASRIIIRTGQPGYAPQRHVVERYDINDYLEKSRLDSDRLLTSVQVALRGYDQFSRLRESERLKAEEIARRTAITDLMADPLIVVDPDGRITLASQAIEEVLGYRPADLIGMPIGDLVHPSQQDSVPRLQQQVDGTEAPSFHRDNLRFRARDGSWKIVNVSGRTGLDVPGLRGGVYLLRDVTDQYLSDEEARRTQKLQAIGRLAGGIAHDFNNILGAIGGFASLIRMDLDHDTERCGYTDRIADACNRGRDLVRQILAFARAEDTVLDTIDVRAVVSESLEMLAAGLERGVGIDADLPDEPIPIVGNRAQVTQLLLNLVSNARDAMPEGSGNVRIELNVAQGRRWDRGGRVESGAGQAVSGSLDAQQRYAFLSVSDQGVGMSAETLQRIFEPFFTTKAIGRGTGLGLSVVHGIVRSHHSAVRVTSELGAGAVFEIAFPLAEGQVVETMDTSANAERQDVSDVRVLIVDDDRDVGESLQTLLARAGYRVEFQSNPVDALEWLRNCGEVVDIVITDESMPGMLGTDLIAAAAEVVPETIFIVYSGYGSNLNRQRAEDVGAFQILEKPASFGSIDRAIRDALWPGE
ncbi:response regulator [Thalassobaculum sp.]|uniref:ATP-binding response regulator n=1 Tax=Thalassobaculum sp. TaxID=2022740 RepID=UPI0032EF740B